jgi:hypothetical protein
MRRASREKRFFWLILESSLKSDCKSQEQLMKILPVVILFTLVNVAFCAIPGANDPHAYTARQYLQDELEFNRRTLAGIYKQVGHRDPKWDKQAIEFLDAMALRFVSTSYNYITRLDEPRPITELEKLGKAVRDAGCDDPLIEDLYSVTLLDQNKVSESKPLNRDAAEKLMTSKYPVFRAANSLRRALRGVKREQSPEDFEHFSKLLFDANAATVKFSDFPGIDRRIVLKMILPDFESWPLQHQQEFWQSLRAANADAWITDILEGEYHISAGWAARGTDWANNVTDEGWKTLHAELVQSRRCFHDAYRLQPKFPEAAVGMIGVCTGDPAPGESLRGWFDRAVAAQIDYNVAYSRYLNAILPRWFGSHELMYQFALECADSGRYDTDVPLYFQQVLNDIVEDSNHDWSYWRQPGVADRSADVLSHYAASTAHPRYFFSETVGYSWQVGRYDLGRIALDKMNGKYDASGFDVAGAIPARAVSCVYAMTSALGPQLKQAEDTIAAGNADAGIKQYQALAQQIKSDDRAAAWILGRPQELLWLQAFDKGDAVNIVPDQHLTGWYNAGGEFTSDGTAVTGQTSSSPGYLLCGTKFGNRWELHATIEVLPDTTGKIPAYSAGGLVFCYTSQTHHMAFSFEPTEQLYGWKWDAYPMNQFSNETSPLNDVVIRVWDNSAQVIINGKPWGKNMPFNESTLRPDNRIGIGSITSAKDSKFSVTQIQIRKLTEEPKPSE